LDLRLRITFESFGTLWKDVQSLKRHKLERYKITDDPEFATAKDTTVEESAATETTRDFKVVPRPPKQIEMFPPGDATDIDQISSRDSETHDGARYALVG